MSSLSPEYKKAAPGGTASVRTPTFGVRYGMMITWAARTARGIAFQFLKSMPLPSTGSIRSAGMSDVTQLSRAAHDRLQAEYEDLTTRGRIDIANAIERARELGDLSENGDYQAAKDQQGHMEGRIRQLEAILKDAVIIEGGEAGVVGAGSVVTILYEGDDEDMAERYLVGHIEERRDDLDIISPGSPMGEALLGHRIGEIVEYQAPSGVMHVKIIAVEAA
jgi:transcription elongation factor GreA